MKLYNVIMGRVGVGGTGDVCWGQTMDILSAVLRSLNFSSIGNEETTRRVSWTSDELIFYFISAT